MVILMPSNLVELDDGGVLDPVAVQLGYKDDAAHGIVNPNAVELVEI